MRKEDCKVGMVVCFGDTLKHTSRFGGKVSRGIIIKVNPKRAKVRSIDPAGRWPAGTTWTCSYANLFPVPPADSITNEMTMRSFENPNDVGIKAWSEAQKSRKTLPETLKPEDEHIMRAVCEIYDKFDDTYGVQKSELHTKLHLLFRALGVEVSKTEAEAWRAGHGS